MKFNVLSSKNIGENKSIVVSEREDGKFSIAQKITANTDGQEIKFFVKNAIQVDKEGLKNIRDAIDEAYKQV